MNIGGHRGVQEISARSQRLHGAVRSRGSFASSGATLRSDAGAGAKSANSAAMSGPRAAKSAAITPRVLGGGNPRSSSQPPERRATNASRVLALERALMCVVPQSRHLTIRPGRRSVAASRNAGAPRRGTLLPSAGLVDCYHQTHCAGCDLAWAAWCRASSIRRMALTANGLRVLSILRNVAESLRKTRAMKRGYGSACARAACVIPGLAQRLRCLSMAILVGLACAEGACGRGVSRPPDLAPAFCRMSSECPAGSRCLNGVCVDDRPRFDFGAEAPRDLSADVTD